MLREQFVVAMCDHHPHHKVSFGVILWVYGPDGKELGRLGPITGNNIIAGAGARDGKVREKIHRDQVEALKGLLNKAP